MPTRRPTNPHPGCPIPVLGCGRDDRPMFARSGGQRVASHQRQHPIAPTTHLQAPAVRSSDDSPPPSLSCSPAHLFSSSRVQKYAHQSRYQFSLQRLALSKTGPTPRHASESRVSILQVVQDIGFGVFRSESRGAPQATAPKGVTWAVGHPSQTPIVPVTIRHPEHRLNTRTRSSNDHGPEFRGQFTATH